VGLALAGAALLAPRPDRAAPVAQQDAPTRDAPGARPPAAAQPAATPALADSAAPVTATGSGTTAADLDACVAGWFPPESFDPDTDLTFVCSEHDGRRGSSKLRRAILAGGKGKKITEAMKEWQRFGWFEVPVFATLRARCCPGAPSVEVTRVPASSCAPPHDAVHALAVATAQGGDVAGAIRSYRKVVSCLVEVGDFPAYGQPGPIGIAEEPAFRAFAERGARR
jgi:hypothetical protein